MTAKEVLRLPDLSDGLQQTVQVSPPLNSDAFAFNSGSGAE